MKAAFALALAVLLSMAGPVLVAHAGEGPDPDADPERLFHEGLNLLRNRDYASAEPIFDAVLRLDPKHIVALYCRGLSRLGTGRAAAAIEDFDAFLARKPDNAKALAQRGRAHLALHDYDKADADLSAAVRLEPGDRSWTWDLEQTRVLARGRRQFGEGGEFPALSLRIASREGGPDPWRSVRGELLPLLRTVSRVERTWTGQSPLEGLLLVFFSSLEDPAERARLSEINEVLPALEAMGVTPAAVSADEPEELWSMKEEKAIGFPLFCDAEGHGAAQVGVLNVRFRELGRSLPAVFLLSADGRILLRRVYFDPERRPPTEDLVLEIRRLLGKEAPEEDGAGAGD